MQTNDAGIYGAVVNNAFGTVTSSNATLTVWVPTLPSITQQPESLSVPVGTNVWFAVAATSNILLRYQWFFDGVVMPGATDTLLTLTNVQASHAGDYTVRITNDVGSATSEVARLTVIVPDPPRITLQPVSRGVFPGLDASFAVEAEGSGPISYQWQRDGVDLSGATNATLSLTNVQMIQAGRYRAIVSNTGGAVPSDEALLAIVPVASWGWNAADQNVLPVTLTNTVAISAGGGHNLALRRDGNIVTWGSSAGTNHPSGLSNIVAVAGGNSYSLALRADGTVVGWGLNDAGETNIPPALSNVVAVAAGASHSLALLADGTVRAWGWNACGQTNVPAGLSNVIAVAAGDCHSVALKTDGEVVAWGANDPGQVSMPTNLTHVVAIAANGNHTLAVREDGTVAAWGDNTHGQATVPASLSNVVAVAAGMTHSLALKRDGTLIAWGASVTDTNPLPIFAGVVVPSTVTNVVSVTGGAAHTLALVGDGPPFLCAQPVGCATSCGKRATFRATASGAWPLNYQWQRNGANIPSATDSVFVVENTDAAAAGSYRVMVTNALGTAISAEAVLTLINVEPVIISQPASQTLPMGASASFSVAATGGPLLTYQWFKNGDNLPGRTSDLLLLTNVNRRDGGVYVVAVGNPCGTTLSSNAVLRVLVPQRLTVGATFLTESFMLTSADAGGTPLTDADLAGFEALSSTNLSDWTPLSNVLTVTNGTLLLRDNESSKYPTRFYRLMER